MLIKAEGAESFQYDKFLQEHPSKLSYVRYLTKQTNKEKILREKTKKAQFHFLEGSLEEARKLFIEIANQRWGQRLARTGEENIYLLPMAIGTT